MRNGNQRSGWMSAIAAAVLGLAFVATEAGAQSSPYAPGWDLDPAASFIRFRSVKNENGQQIIETHSFATFSSTIEADGTAQIVVKLDSVDTNNDLRNVRMRFLFFETFKYPDAVVRMQLTPEMADGLAQVGQKTVAIPFDFSLQEVTNRMTANVSVTAETNDRLVVTSAAPVIFRTDEFGMTDNLTKIAETAGGFDIVPQMNITFQFAYNKRAGGTDTQVVAQAAPQPQPQAQVQLAEPTAAPAEAALETQGEFSMQECVGRFEILSETGNIYFASGSARLDNESRFVLATVIDIVRRCPGLRVQISGHTDSDGSASYNQDLSRRRAQSVVSYLTSEGIDYRRLFSTGYGEDRPMVPNDSPFNKGRNRRIEFSLYR